MKISQLLVRRDALLQEAQLANLAFAYAQLAAFSARITRAGLRGKVTLRHAAPEQESYCATLVALDGHQSVIEEHFTDLDIMDLADVIAFLGGQSRLELTFPIEEIGNKFLVPLRLELGRLGVSVDAWSRPEEPSPEENPPQFDRPQIEETK